MQRTLCPNDLLHVACVMDGNGRWATARGLPRAAGHRAGAEALRHVVEAAPALGVGTLTVYAFSADNWSRPSGEVSALMALLGGYLRSETSRLKRAGVRLQLIGRRDRLPVSLRNAAARAEWETRGGTRLTLRVAVDYSARWALRAAAAHLARLGPEADDTDPDRRFEAALATVLHPDGAPAPPVDLFLRTGGEQRLSDFLLWESAYAELLFLDTMWPDMTGAALAGAIADFHTRTRRFGGLVAA
ncbi:di-trans,poly-cis-decaprenylcistransferase [Rubrivirga sp. SAORIC476]|uniref:polyprenyl diphosphate synthase n=1 Tax=Rubrivirga sp. SAORIC476 TaxID=1961794 RepID=UPI000BD6256F|nr:polyprenyl diphosphate synthase [Rubrivirga sp. SAORIC476]PAP79184.1 di-trans,poly-cis-decaprenylcistransferase [Rubrivirga sp. SAORIC476]